MNDFSIPKNKKKRVTIGGKIATGTSSVLKEIKSRLGDKWSVHSTGDAMRELADSYNMNIYKFLANPPTDIDIDEVIDTKAMGWLSNDNVVIDSRCAHGYADRNLTVTVLLVAPDDVRLQRYMSRELLKHPELTKEKAIEQMEMRDVLDIKRFKKFRKTNSEIYDKENFDLILDSSKLSVNEIVDEILKHVEV